MTLGKLQFVKFTPNGIVKGLTIDLDAARAVPTRHGRLPSGVIAAILVQQQLGFNATMQAALLCEIYDRTLGSKCDLKERQRRKEWLVESIIKTAESKINSRTS
jgi:hypothetical protein